MFDDSGWYSQILRFGRISGLVEGKIYRKPQISHEIWDVPVKFPLNQSIDRMFHFMETLIYVNKVS